MLYVCTNVQYAYICRYIPVYNLVYIMLLIAKLLSVCLLVATTVSIIFMVFVFFLNQIFRQPPQITHTSNIFFYSIMIQVSNTYILLQIACTNETLQKHYNIIIFKHNIIIIYNIHFWGSILLQLTYLQTKLLCVCGVNA